MTLRCLFHGGRTGRQLDDLYIGRVLAEKSADGLDGHAVILAESRGLKAVCRHAAERRPVLPEEPHQGESEGRQGDEAEELSKGALPGVDGWHEGRDVGGVGHGGPSQCPRN